MNPAEPSNPAPCDLRIGGPAWREAEADGHDMSLIVEALRMPVAERMRMHDMALSAVLELREAFIKQHGGIRETDRAAH